MASPDGVSFNFTQNLIRFSVVDNNNVMDKTVSGGKRVQKPKKPAAKKPAAKKPAAKKPAAQKPAAKKRGGNEYLEEMVDTQATDFEIALLELAELAVSKREVTNDGEWTAFHRNSDVKVLNTFNAIADKLTTSYLNSKDVRAYPIQLSESQILLWKMIHSKCNL